MELEKLKKKKLKNILTSIISFNPLESVILHSCRAPLRTLINHVQGIQKVLNSVDGTLWNISSSVFVIKPAEKNNTIDNEKEKKSRNSSSPSRQTILGSGIGITSVHSFLHLLCIKRFNYFVLFL